MIVQSRRVKGHARTVVAVRVEHRDHFRRVAGGYVARCACGWESPVCQIPLAANCLHEQHKASL